ncbi:MAG: hypothetical protein PHI31_09785 [Desulfuromonadaceae bacterium]|nr:hypothetical protein [Desulfuromonadaceae bacterium]
MPLPIDLEKPITMITGTYAEAADVNADFDYVVYAINETNTQVNTNTIDISAAAAALIISLALKLDKSAVDTDATMAANSDTKIASQKATKALITATAFLAALPDQAGNGGKLVTTNGTDASWLAPATQGEAQAGTNETAWMTPLRTAEAIAALSPPFSDSTTLAQIQSIALSM